MKQRLLTALQPSPRTQAILGELRREECLLIECVEDSRAALEKLSHSEPPGGILAQLDQQAPGFLELLTSIDRLRPRIPLLGTANGGLVRDLPVETSSLPLLDLELPPTDFAARVASAVSGSSNGGHAPSRQGVDYLLAAILCRRSVNLDLLSTNGLEVSVELVGGDVWNAYGGDLEAVSALEAILFEPVSRVAIRTVQMVPGERQIRHPSVEALGLGTRHLEPRRGEAVGAQESHRQLGTREFDMQALVAELRTANSRRIKPAGEPESSDERFERLLATGIEASLSRDYPRAGRAFEEAMTLRPDDPRVRHNLERIRRHL